MFVVLVFQITAILSLKKYTAIVLSYTLRLLHQAPSIFLFPNKAIMLLAETLDAGYLHFIVQHFHAPKKWQTNSL
jgi:hypothetical protein